MASVRAARRLPCTLGVMRTIDSPAALASVLTELFPPFASELEDEEITSYHQVVQRLAPVLTGFLQERPKKATEEFCSLVNEMVAAGGEMENAISTCLLEHASQIRVRNVIRPYLSVAAKHELR
jgi:hypothetical protein